MSRTLFISIGLVAVLIFAALVSMAMEAVGIPYWVQFLAGLPIGWFGAGLVVEVAPE